MVEASSVLESVPLWGWLAIGIGLYWLAVGWLQRTGRLPEAVGTQGPVLTLHTRRFRALVDRIASRRRAWRAWGNAGVGVALVVMAGSLVFLAYAAYRQFQDPAAPTAVNQPRNILVIPGVNDFLPLSVAPEIVAGLVVGLVVHEGGHAIMCRVGDIEIESMGLAFLAIVPIGAFVEPNEDSRRSAGRGDQTRMFAAGVMNNFAVAFLGFALLFGPVVGAIAVAPGAAVGGVYPGSSAAEAGIDAGDRIVAVGGRPVANNSALGTVLAGTDDRQVEVRVDDGRTTRTVPVNRSLLVVGSANRGPFGDVEDGERIVRVNGTAVGSEAGLRSALVDRRVATLETDDGTVVTGPIGAFVNVTGDGPLARAGAPPGPAVVTSLGGERVLSASDLSDALAGTRPDQTVPVTLVVDGETRTVDVTLDAHPSQDQGFLGVLIVPGFSGLTVSDFGTSLYPADLYLRAIGGGPVGAPFLQQVIVGLQLPLIGMLGVLPFNFAGFTGGTANFYRVPGLLSSVPGLLFGLANVLFWSAWINLNLAIFNCIPAFPLDGGHILRTSTEAIVSRLPVRGRRELTRAVTTSVGLLMLASLIVMLFGPQFLR